ncbi:hypothetical protein COO60DRAFT_1478577 [Scenedesmus sp. NREL 46B-D3]|nr:hypothetical protein COO60DRAFT_1478577 [Scenedesmus sp. NREL 46B-D3]
MYRMIVVSFHIVHRVLLLLHIAATGMACMLHGDNGNVFEHLQPWPTSVVALTLQAAVAVGCHGGILIMLWQPHQRWWPPIWAPQQLVQAATCLCHRLTFSSRLALMRTQNVHTGRVCCIS